MGSFSYESYFLKRTDRANILFQRETRDTPFFAKPTGHELMQGLTVDVSGLQAARLVSSVK